MFYLYSTSEPDWAKVIAEIKARHTRLDGLVNNAGIAHLGSIEDTSLADWHRVTAVDANGVFLGCKTAWSPVKRSQAPAIVNLSSVSGLIGGANLAASDASKGAVPLLTKSVALHGAHSNPPIRCNSVHPTFVEGTMLDNLAAATRNPERAREKMAAAIPRRRLAKPQDIAASIVHLLSPAASYITGSEMAIDGGLVAG